MQRRTLLAGLAALPPAARAQGIAAPPPGYPDRPISLVVPFTPGGSTDIAARVLAERMGQRLAGEGFANARLIVENRAGAGGSVGSEYVRRAAPDGYTLLVATASSHGSNPAALPQTTPYDPVEDFTAISVIGGGPMVLVVPNDSPYRDVAALFAALRRPGAHASWATSGAGGIGHLTGELMLHRAGIAGAEHVPYRGGSAVMEALAKGEVEFSLEVLATTAPHLRDGLSRALAVSSLRRTPLFPAVPTLDESGLRGFDITTWNVLLGPRGLPPAVAELLSRTANAVLADPAVRERLNTAGVEPADPGSPAATRAFLTAELAKFRGIVAESGLRLSR
ncbi:tripartite tricarboxylate transporter substrate-binding protein [Roseomonas sp. NAR14]|uniref:Tripartite tricarboxylate transporter substrate-binding protein n=1 Tax=Roseomonas acroporae TaxID=2937791 RepID=A0A9X1Y4F6_9PROT|nr:tripartite tricarboxylate transporter substrate-binding protein [Roseomonas acroporae]MCK8784039.1 tripartite tricarboxylate transporter substrate-binding protein [Roseomonas acroporae]